MLSNLAHKRQEFNCPPRHFHPFLNVYEANEKKVFGKRNKGGSLGGKWGERTGAMRQSSVQPLLPLSAKAAMLVFIMSVMVGRWNGVLSERERGWCARVTYDCAFV